MRRILLVLSLLALSGCAAQLQKLENAYAVITSATVSPTAIIVAANAFDAIEQTATNYLTRPKCAGQNGPLCRSPVATQKIIPAIRAGRVARNNAEQFLKDNPGKLGTSGLYNALIAATNTLQGVMTQYP